MVDLRKGSIYYSFLLVHQHGVSHKNHSHNPRVRQGPKPLCVIQYLPPMKTSVRRHRLWNRRYHATNRQRHKSPVKNQHVKFHLYAFHIRLRCRIYLTGVIEVAYFSSMMCDAKFI